MDQKKKPISHPKLGGKYIEHMGLIPQRKTNKSMTGEELLAKVAAKLKK